MQVDARELFRQLMQDQLDLRAQSEPQIADVRDARRVARRSAETEHARALTTVFGEVDVRRSAYRKRGQGNLHPADAALNLPVEKHSHGLQQLAAKQSSRGSFEGAVQAIGRSTGQHLGKRQAEDLACVVSTFSWPKPEGDNRGVDASGYQSADHRRHDSKRGADPVPAR